MSPFFLAIPPQARTDVASIPGGILGICTDLILFYFAFYFILFQFILFDLFLFIFI